MRCGTEFSSKFLALHEKIPQVFLPTSCLSTRKACSIFAAFWMDSGGLSGSQASRGGCKGSKEDHGQGRQLAMGPGVPGFDQMRPHELTRLARKRLEVHGTEASLKVKRDGKSCQWSFYMTIWYIGVFYN